MVFLVTFLIALFLSASAHEDTLLSRTHAGLSKVLDFLLTHYKSINIDCLYETVLGLGFLDNILKLNLDQEDLDLINGYKKTIEEIIRLARPRMFGKSQKFDIFTTNLIVSDRWNRTINFKKDVIDANFQPPLDSPVGSRDSYIYYETDTIWDGQQSDKCILEILNSGSYKKPHQCNISKICLDRIVEKKEMKQAYDITHRLLYLQMGLTQNCKFNLERYLKHTSRYCSFIYWDVKQDAKYGFVNKFSDLLMEQVTLCGAEGFDEFLREDVLEFVLLIQTQHGCFLSPDFKQGHAKRQRRNANVIEYGCSDHTTGLGVSTLSLFLLHMYQHGK